MKKNKLYIIGIALFATISVIALIFFSSNVIKNANISSEKEVVATTNEKNIFGTFEMSANWAKDPLVPENIIEMSKNCAVIKAKIISVGEAKFLNEKDPSPYTPVEVEIEEILDGTLEKGNKTIYVEGGEIRVSEVLKTLNEAEKEKMELNKISEDEANNMFIIYETEEDYKMELGNEYILVLSNKDNSIVMANGYGIFVEKDGSIINVLTGNKLDIKR